jgi:hypothetical protein
MKLSPSREAVSQSATQEFSNILWNPKGSLLCWREASSGLHPKSNQSSTYHTIISLLISTLTSSSHLCLGISICLFPSGFPSHTGIPLLPLLRYMSCPSHPPCLHYLTILSEKCKLWSILLYSFLHPPVTSSLFSPHILPSTLFTNILSLYSSVVSETKFHTHTELQEKWYIPTFFLF